MRRTTTQLTSLPDEKFVNPITRFLALSLLILALIGIHSTKTLATTCANAITIPASPALPYSLALTCGTSNNITSANSTACGSGSYKGGLEALYTWTPTASYTGVTIAYSGQTWSGITVYNGCPTSGGTCVGSTTSSSSSKTLSIASITAGVTYFIMFDTWPSPASPCPGTFTLNGNINQACSGTPSPGNTIVSTSTVCVGASVNLSLQTSTSGTGITYQWQSSANPTGPWTNFGTSTATQSAVVSGNTYYRAVVTCSGSGQSGTSNPVLVSTISGLCQCGTYPNAFASSTADEEITNVTVGTMSNSSTCGTTAPGAGSILNRYSNYTNSVAGPSSQPGQPVSFSLTQTSCGGAYSNGFQIYIDFNQNGSFLDAGEQVYSQPVAASGNHTKTGTFIVPVNASIGSTRMRVVNVEATFPTATNYAQSGYTWGETEDYCFTVLAPPPCVGLPNPGNSIASITSGCSGAAVSLSLQNATAGVGVTYQWQSSASPTGPWTNISNGTGSTASITISATLYYQCVVTCSGSGQSGTSNPVLITQLTGACACATYPTAFASSTFDEEITNVTVGSMNNSSTCATTAPGLGSINQRYSNYTGALAGPTAQQGDLVSFSLTQTSCGGAYSNGFQIYIDFNQNGSFADIGDQVYSQPFGATGNQTVTGTFTVPPTALVGTTRMRVVNVETTFPTTTNYAQSGYTWGETEDYCFTVLAPPPCTGTPNPGNTLATRETVCSGSSTSVTLSLENFTPGAGLVYQWQSAPSLSGPWTNFGAGGLTQSVTPTVDTWYRAQVDCFGNIGTSTPVRIKVANCISVNMTQGTTTTCAANFYDTGGPNGNYTNSENIAQTFVPSNTTDRIRLSFSSFQSEQSFDFITIFNGPDVTSPVLYGPLSGTLSIPTFTSTHPSGALTVRFTSDGSVVAPGWTAFVECIPPPPCTGTPAPGNTIASATSICGAIPVTLSLQNQLSSGGLSYQWQSSNSLAGPWTDFGGGAFNQTVTPPAGVSYYRAAITCAVSGGIGTSNPVSVDATVIPAPSVQGNTRCGTGTTNLSATADPGLTINWYSAATGGNLVGSGSSFTTPLINSTTTYYAAASNAAGGSTSLAVAPIAGGNGCSGGNMFNVIPNSSLSITSFTANLTNVGTQTVSIYYKTGSYVGSQTNASAWTLHETVTVSGSGSNTPTIVNLNSPLNLQAGTTYGLYFNANVQYTNNSGLVTASNTDLTVQLGEGLCGFFSSNIANRTWNGSISYTVGCESARIPVVATVTPAPPITLTASNTNVCSGNPVTLNVSSGNAGYNYTWSSNPAGFTGSGSSVTATTTGSGNVTYSVLADDGICGATESVVVSVGTNNLSLTVTGPTAVCSGKDAQLNANASEGSYCVPLNSTGCTFPDIITGVDFGGIVNTSTCNNTTPGQGGFSYFTTPNPTYVAGTSYPITVSTGGDTEGIGVWIDFNQNLLFEPTELVLSGYAGTNPATYTGNVTIPANAINGQTRIRVRCTYAADAGSIGPCTAVTWGETEDYLITVSGGVTVGSGFTYSWSPATFLSASNISNPIAQAMNAPISYDVTVTSGATGCVKTETKTINVNPLPVPFLTPNSPAVCEGNTIELIASNGTSYQFTYPGGTSVTLPGTIFGVVVTPTTSATFGVHDGYYSVQVTDANGCSQSDSVYVGVNQLPSVSLVSSTPASCPDSYDGSFEVQSLTGTPPFTFTEIGVSGGSLVSFDGIFPSLGIGTYTVIVQDGAQPVNCFSAITLDAVVDTIPNTPPVLIGTPSNVTTANSPGLCGNVVTYTAPTAYDDCPTDLGAVIQISGLPSGSLFPIGTTVNSFSVTDAEGVETITSFTVTVNDAQSPVIANVPASFSSCNPVTWTPPTVTDNCPGVVTTASHLPGTNFPAGTTTVTYTSTDVYGNVSTSSFNVTRLEASADPTSVTSNRDFNNICVGENIVLTVNGGSLGDAASWKWYRSTCGGATNLVGAGTSITVAPTVTTTYFVRAEGTCNITACQSITVVVSTTGPGSAPTFSTLPANAAPGVTTQVCVNPVPGAIAYQWFTQVGHGSAILFNGATGPVQTSSNCVNVSFVQPQQNYFIRVFALNACGRTNQANATTRGTVAAPTALTGAITACPGDVKTYNITVAPSQSPVTYNWVLTPVPAGSATISVASNQLSANVTYLPGFQSATLCVNGVSTFNLPGPAVCINISNAAPTPGPITGLAQPCEGSTQTYSVAPVTGATSYSWSSSVAGAVVTGNGTSATVVFPANVFSGDVCVVANSSCGASAPSCINVTSGAPGNPGAITGPVQGVCGITANYSLSTSNANSYIWTAPAGATVVSANGANSANIQFGPGFTSGIVQVEAFYDCGSSTVSLAVNAVPAAPTITPGTICENSAATYFASALGATSFTWTTSGDILDEYPTSPNANTYYLEVGAGSSAATVVASNACGSSAATTINSTSCLRAGDVEGLGTRVYPNPNDGSMFVEFRAITAGMHQIVVTDLAGKVVLTKQVDAQTGAYTQQIDIQNNGAGLYMLYVKDPEGRISVDKVAVE